MSQEKKQHLGGWQHLGSKDLLVWTMRILLLVLLTFGHDLWVSESCTEWWGRYPIRCSCLRGCLNCDLHMTGYNITICHMECKRTRQNYVDSMLINSCGYGLGTIPIRDPREITPYDRVKNEDNLWSKLIAQRFKK